MDYKSNKRLEDELYDDFNITFNSNKIKINIESIKGKSFLLFKKENFYKSEDINELSNEDLIIILRYLQNMHICRPIQNQC